MRIVGWEDRNGNAATAIVAPNRQVTRGAILPVDRDDQAIQEQFLDLSTGDAMNPELVGRTPRHDRL
jgi:hypothetical protein